MPRNASATDCRAPARLPSAPRLTPSVTARTTSRIAARSKRLLVRASSVRSRTRSRTSSPLRIESLAACLMLSSDCPRFSAMVIHPTPLLRRFHRRCATGPAQPCDIALYQSLRAIKKPGRTRAFREADGGLLFLRHRRRCRGLDAFFLLVVFDGAVHRLLFRDAGLLGRLGGLGLCLGSLGLARLVHWGQLRVCHAYRSRHQ